MFHKIKYPKFLLLLTTIIFAIILFKESNNYQPLYEFLLSLGYFGTFLSGLLYAYGFTAAPATSVLLILSKEQNLVTAVLIGGFGALLSDMVIFSVIRYSFLNEIHHLQKEKIIKNLKKEGKKTFGHYYKHIFPTFAGFLIASPLPTEIGVTMMASIKRISIKKFMIIAYLLHSLGILIILLIGKML